MSKLVEKREEYAAKQAKLHKVFEEAKTENSQELDLDKVTSIEGDTAQKLDFIRKMNQELDDLFNEVQGLADLERIKNADERRQIRGDDPEPIVFPGGGEPRKSIGELIVESEAVKGFKGGTGPVAEIDVDTKTLFETSAGWAPETFRTGRMVEYATRPIQVIDVIPGGNTDQVAVVYMEETTFTNAAAETAEGGAYPEAALELTEQSSPVQKIAVFIPVTDEQLEDVAQVQSYLDNRLRFMLRQRLDGQILVGDGIAPNLTGILNVAGIQTQALGADPVVDAFYKAMTLVRVTGRAVPSAIMIHPNDWQPVRLLRTTDGIYIMGNPTDAGPTRLWGVPVVETDAITENTGLVGDFANFIELTMRRGIMVQISNSHADYFVNGKQAIRADMRAALPVYRPAAFCTVTGI